MGVKSYAMASFGIFGIVTTIGPGSSFVGAIISLIVSSIVVAFGLSNFLTGLKIEDSQNIINLPMNIKLLAMFAILVYGLSLLLKQGVFNFYQNKTKSSVAAENAQKLLITSGAIFFSGIYVKNLIYYLSVNPAFAILISLFFVGMSVILSCAAGYFKFNGHAMLYELDKNEYREDLEMSINTMQKQWEFS